MITLYKSTTWVMLDKSVVIQELPDVMGMASCIQVNRFGDLAVGTQNVTSIYIRMFGTVFQRVRDAYVCVTFTNADGAANVRGFHARATRTGHTTAFAKRKLKGLDDAGSCPVCLETRLDKMSPMQEFGCGHGLCVRCFAAAYKAGHDNCSLCRTPIGMRPEDMSTDRLFELRGCSIESMYMCNPLEKTAGRKLQEFREHLQR